LQPAGEVWMGHRSQSASGTDGGLPLEDRGLSLDQLLAFHEELRADSIRHGVRYHRTARTVSGSGKEGEDFQPESLRFYRCRGNAREEVYRFPGHDSERLQGT